MAREQSSSFVELHRVRTVLGVCVRFNACELFMH